MCIHDGHFHNSSSYFTELLNSRGCWYGDSIQQIMAVIGEGMFIKLVMALLSGTFCLLTFLST